jgi:YHS domain-containing protein/thiol-disulfide isomerase/thioredoxin
MSRLQILVFAGILFSPHLPLEREAAAGEPAGQWRTDFAAAQAEAERDHKPMLIHFYATWCLPCSKMDREVLKSADVKQRLGEKFIAVKVDSDQHPDLVQRFGVQLLPSDVIVNPMNGRVLLESQGVRETKSYISLLTQADAKFQAASRKTAIPSSKQAATKPAAAGPLPVQLGDPKPLVGLDGYSPIQLLKNRTWVRGSAEFSWDYQGILYYLSSREELLEFRGDPGRYAPRLLGCDPVILWEADRAVAGRTLFGAFYDDELYFFVSNENRQRFKANPERFIKTQHVLRVDQIDRTALVEKQKS